MHYLRRDFGLAFLLFGAAALLPGLYFSILMLAASPPFERAADAVECEPTAVGQSCVGSTCRGLSESEWALDHDEMIKGERRMILEAGLLLVGAGLVLTGVGGVLRRNTGAPASGH